MNFPLFSCRRVLLSAMIGLAALPAAAFADDITPPKVVKPLEDLNVIIGTDRSVVNLKKTFALDGVTGQVVRFETSLGNMDVELDATDYPVNVSNFLNYVNSGGYNGTFIHRSIAGFIFQGGGYHVTGDLEYPHIAVNGAITGEHKGSNVRGTIAFALTGGTDSANTGTSEWFFNLADNTALDSFASNQGPFTAFGRVIEGDLTTMDAIAAVMTYNASGVVKTADHGVFTDLPLINYMDSQGNEIDSDLVYINKVSLIPLVPNAEGVTALLKLKVTNSNPALVTAVIKGRKLKLTYNAEQTGTAVIKVIAKDSTGKKAKARLNVTVAQRSPD